jgi:hypothetical protein
VSDRVSRKILVQRPAIVRREDPGRSDGSDPEESAELELVSTQMLKAILSSRNDRDRKAIEATARSESEGVLARNPASGRFELIGEEELEKILESHRALPKIRKPADATLEPLRDYVAEDELSLVSSRALRRVLGDEPNENAPERSEETPAGATGEFNPYDNA